MKKSEDLAKKIIVLMYVLGLLGMLGIVIAVHITRQYGEQEAAGYTNISDSWTLDREGTEPIDLGSLGRHMDEQTGMVSVYQRLPELDGDASLVYQIGRAHV